MNETKQTEEATNKEAKVVELTTSPINNEKKVLIIGSDDPEMVKNIKLMMGELHKDTHILFTLDKDMFNRTTSAIVNKFKKLTEDEKLQDYMKKPENLQETLRVAAKLEEALGEDRQWFYIDDIVHNTNMSFKQASNTLDLLFAFGFVAIDESEKKSRYLLVSDPDKKLKYIETIEGETKKELKALQTIKKQFIKEMKKGLVVETSEEKKKAEDTQEELSEKKEDDKDTMFGNETQKEVGP